MTDPRLVERNARDQSGPGRELRFSHTQTYFDKSITIRILIGLLFAFFLFLFLHFRQTYVETLESGSKATRHIVSQVDFAFPDEEATIIVKQEAARAIGGVYRIQEDQVHKEITEFQKFITQNEEGSKKWHDLAESSGFKDLPLALSLLSNGLVQSRFTDARTVQEIGQLPKETMPIPGSLFFVFIPPTPSCQGKLPYAVWNSLGKQIFVEEDIPPEIISFVLRTFEKVSWRFDSDPTTEYTLRKLIQSRIPERYTHVMSGERIIDQGERVSARHVAMLQAMKEKLDQERKLVDPLTIAGSVLMTLLFLFVAAIYLKENHKEIFYSNRNLSLLGTIVILNLLLAKLTEWLLLKSSNSAIDLIRFPLFVPFAAILLNSLMNIRIAAFATLFLSIIFTIVIPVESVPFLVINILTSTVAILSTRLIRRRKDVFTVCAKAWIASLLVIVAFNLYENKALSFPFLSDVWSTFLFMAVTSILVVSILPILESLFQIMTDITLMEFMDPNNEYLRRLTVEAPGTFQHSMVVGNLAEAAAHAIGANGLFCRVATEYHDIGKLVNPQYFTENQLGGVDMHQLLTPFESAQVIIAHVSEGVALARKIGLPEPFIDVIKEHHGTTLVYYFFHKQIEMLGGERSKVESKEFRYSGPRPRTKESTIIMIADTLEAASRSLDTFNEETVTELVDSLIAQKSEDGQFDESPLTFEELGIVKRTLVKNLLAASHPRIKYPPHHPGEEG
jgi:putative nucleotidyltransferase with HDIG domain